MKRVRFWPKNGERPGFAIRALFFVIIALASLAACTLGPRPSSPITSYDFGLPAAAPEGVTFKTSYLVPETDAPAWLATTAIAYRLTYANASAWRAYADSRWTAPPAELLTQKLRRRLAAAGATVLTDDASALSEYVLRVRLEEFAQVFETASQSRVAVSLSATLVRRRNGERAALAQQSFTTEEPTMTADAEGAALALAAASDRAISELLRWAAAKSTTP